FLDASFSTLRVVEQRREELDTVYTVLFDERQPGDLVSCSISENKQYAELRGKQAQSLWMRLVRVYTLWVSLGMPEITTYGFEMKDDGQRYILNTGYGKASPFL